MNLQQGIMKDRSVRLLLLTLSIFRCLLLANCKENLTTRFYAKKQNGFLNAYLHFLTLPWQRRIRQLKYQKSEDCVVSLIAAIFVEHRIKGLRKKSK